MESRTYSLRQFIATAKALDSEENFNFQTFVLTGVNAVAGHKAFVDVTSDELVDDDFTMARDYDSLIGITETLVVDTHICIYPIPNPSEVLRSTIHLKFPIEQEDRLEQVPIHKIPNYQFGTWSTRCQVHIFFPKLAFNAENRGKQVSEECRAAFYEKALRPSIEQLLAGEAVDWAPSYSAEKFRAKKNAGTMSYQTKVLSQFVLRDLVTVLREKVSEEPGLEWAEDFFFTHTARGLKGAERHSFAEESDTAEALSSFLDAVQLPPGCIDQGMWWIDVGMEVYSESGLCLQWSTAWHCRVVQEILEIEESTAERITGLGSSKYEKDICSHLMGVAGCRIEPGQQAEGPYEAAYLQLYTTDKALTYCPEGSHHGKTITMAEAMGPTQPTKFVEGLLSLLREAMTCNSSNARMEVRVPISKACHALTQIDRHVIQQSLIGFKRSDWWNFRMQRLEAISRTLLQQQSGPTNLRVGPNALSLTAACVWLVNALHSRPEDDAAHRSLMRAVSPLTDAPNPDHHALIVVSRDSSNSSDESVLPYFADGVIFLREIRFQEHVPRMGIDNAYGYSIDSASFKHLFGSTEEELRYRYHRVGILPRGVMSQTRVVTNKTRITTNRMEFGGEEQETIFDLASRGFSIPRPDIDDGSDMEDVEEESSDGIDAKLTKLWRQFLVDIALKTPVPKGTSLDSYLKLTLAERQEVTEELYMDLCLSKAWRACFWKLATNADRNLTFGHLFPEKNHELPGTAQNYGQSRYYRQWKEICASADARTVNAIRADIRQKFNQLNWVPATESGKIWQTKQSLKGYQRFPPQSTGPAPHILCKKRPTWE